MLPSSLRLGLLVGVHQFGGCLGGTLWGTNVCHRFHDLDEENNDSLRRFRVQTIPGLSWLQVSEAPKNIQKYPHKGLLARPNIFLKNHPTSKTTKNSVASYGHLLEAFGTHSLLVGYTQTRCQCSSVSTFAAWSIHGRLGRGF